MMEAKKKEDKKEGRGRRRRGRREGGEVGEESFGLVLHPRFSPKALSQSVCDI